MLCMLCVISRERESKRAELLCCSLCQGEIGRALVCCALSCCLASESDPCRLSEQSGARLQRTVTLSSPLIALSPKLRASCQKHQNPSKHILKIPVPFVVLLLQTLLIRLVTSCPWLVVTVAKTDWCAACTFALVAATSAIVRTRKLATYEFQKMSGRRSKKRRIVCSRVCLK